MISCKDNNSSTSTDTHKIATVAYQCPMDCENGKTYDAKRNCPICNMDLEALGHSGDCSCVKDEKCTCTDGKCTCKDCPEHS